MTRRQRWFTRWNRWEFWPFWIFYIPVYFYYLWLSFREGSLFYFTATNPSMEFGGMIGERKSEIYRKLPPDSLPKTTLIATGDLERALDAGEKTGYPLIAKPNIGERGKGVELIRNVQELNRYAIESRVDFLIQEYVSFPLEVGVFYIRYPFESSGRITSLVGKEYLKVIGDGVQTVTQLVESTERGALQVNTQDVRFQPLREVVPEKGEEVTIEPIGNHCRGTKFLNWNEHIDRSLEMAIDRLAQSYPDFHYGRFDLKCQSLDDLRSLRNFKVVELNGVGAEPAHIYHPGFSIWKAYRTVFWHFNQMALISRANRKEGIECWSFRRGLKKLSDIRAYNRRLIVKR